MSTSNEQSRVAASIDRAIDAFREGRPVLIHDAADREGETDIVYPAGAMTPEAVARLRNDAGGLVCLALSYDAAEALDLPFRQETIDHPVAADHDLGYDERSSFSLTVNHRDTYTGITDEDRALTITEMGALTEDPDPAAFAENFRAPGHVHVLKAAPGLLADRRGHTELGLALADAAGLPPAVVVCEMLDDESGRERPPAAAREYAETHGFPYLEGREVVEHLG
jgi:3,4-dihydroxy 2-butanone 4-phosphate synthase